MGIDIPVNEKGRRIGQYHQRSTISDEMVEQMREMHEERGKSYGQIALKFKKSVNTVKKICRYERRAETVHHWKRLDDSGRPVSRPGVELCVFEFDGGGNPQRGKYKSHIATADHEWSF